MLVADVGGTNVRFALAAADRHPPLIEDSIRIYRVADFDSFDAAARRYLEEIGTTAERGVVAMAGLFDGDTVVATNSGWRVNGAATRKALGMRSVRLVNDFTAMSMCLPLLDPDQIETVGDIAAPTIGAAESQTFAVVGPGTGLGVGGLLLRGGRFEPLQTEGGHSSFAPANAEEREVLARLAARFGHVSNERLVSGQGLVNLHAALSEIAGAPAATLAPEDITARADSDTLCRRAVETFCAVLGGVAGDVAMTLGAWDGVYLGGGLPPVLLERLRGSAFRERFEAKGRLAVRLREVPTVVIMYGLAGLLGAAGIAQSDAGAALLQKPAGIVASQGSSA